MWRIIAIKLLNDTARLVCVCVCTCKLTHVCMFSLMRDKLSRMLPPAPPSSVIAEA